MQGTSRSNHVKISYSINISTRTSLQCILRSLFHHYVSLSYPRSLFQDSESLSHHPVIHGHLTTVHLYCTTWETCPGHFGRWSSVWCRWPLWACWTSQGALSLYAIYIQVITWWQLRPVMTPDLSNRFLCQTWESWQPGVCVCTDDQTFVLDGEKTHT